MKAHKDPGIKMTPQEARLIYNGTKLFSGGKLIVTISPFRNGREGELVPFQEWIVLNKEHFSLLTVS